MKRTTLKDLSIRSKLTLAFGGLAAIVIAVAVSALLAVSAANTRFVDYTQGLNARAMAAVHVREAVDARAIAARNLVLLKDTVELRKEHEAVVAAHKEVQTALAKLKTMVNGSANASEQARELVQGIDQVEQRYGPVALSIVELALSGKQEQAIAKMNEECRPLLSALIKASDAYERYTAQRTAALQEAAAADYAQQRAMLIALCAISVVLALAAGWLITRSIVGPLGHAIAAADRIAHGDLTSDIEATSADEAGRLLERLQQMQQSLRRTVTAVRDSARGVSLATTEIAQGNSHLSQRTEEQASALQQTTASMEQLSSSVQSTAQHAQSAGELADQMSSSAQRGGAVMNDVVATMQSIDESSRRIVEIIDLVEGIAFQTNILSLNAAVEAARAGDQGRGFTVVATEVRQLANRSTAAAKEIKTLITESAGRVKHGVTLVDRAGTTMQEIVGTTQRVADLMGEIGSASAEQGKGVGHVGAAMVQIDQATQQNSALVEESAAAAASLDQQARDLVDAVAVFRVDDETGHAPAPKATAPQAAAAASAGYAGIERRSPHRATNVTRLDARTRREPVRAAVPAPAAAPQARRTGTDGWERF